MGDIVGIMIFILCTVPLIIGIVVSCSGKEGQFNEWDEYEKQEELEEQYSKYAKIIADASVMYLDDIAARYPKPVQSVCDDLQELIQEGYFSKHYIDWVDRKIVFSGDPKNQVLNRKQSPSVQVKERKQSPPAQVKEAKESPPVQVKEAKESPPVQNKEPDESPQVKHSQSNASKPLGRVTNVVKCSNCGGITRLSNGEGDCDYCGTPLR